MKTLMRAIVPIALAILAAPHAVAAQEAPDSVREVRLIDGSTLYGTVLDDGDPLRLRLLSGDEISIARVRIRSIAPAKGRVRDGELWREDPNLTRLFFAPTARTMPKGHGYLAAYELVFPFVAFAPTDNILVAGGTPLFGDIDDHRVVYFAPKVQLYGGPRTSFAVGAFFFDEIGNDYSDWHFGALYGVLTTGDSDNALTLAAGVGYDEHGVETNHPVVMVGGEFRVSRTIKIVTENYLLTEGTLFSIGPRFFGERLSADLGIGVTVDEGDAFTLPIVNFVYVF